MVALLLAALMAPEAQAAGAVTLAPTVGVVGRAGEVGPRPGLRLGFEPVPAASLELMTDVGLTASWDAGLALSGRAFLMDEAEGLYLVGRVGVGLSGDPADIAPWTQFMGGFGARPAGTFFVEALGGPDFALGGPGWRSELAVGVVFGGPKGLGPKPGQGTVRHRPTRKPGD